MDKTARSYTASGVSFFAYAALTQVVSGVYLAAELSPPPLLLFITPLGFLWASACWLQRDMHARNFRWALDLGFILYVAGILILPYYLLKTRGPRSILLMIGFVAVYFVSLLVGAASFILMAP